MIDLEKAKHEFDEYVSHYDLHIPQIHLKYIHSYKVVDVIDELCDMRGVKEEKDLCLLIGLLHDIGRFEQFRIYHSFIDYQTVDHAAFSSYLLFEKGLIRRFIEKDTYDSIIQHAIEQHNKYQIDEGFDEEELFYIYMIRDADKLDHFRVKETEKDTTLLGVTYRQAGQETISDAVYDQFMHHQLIYAPTRQTHLDQWISYIAFIYDLHFDESKQYINSHNYIHKSFDKIKVTHEETKKRYDELRKCALDYIRLKAVYSDSRES